jgi:hypothetical protein
MTVELVERQENESRKEGKIKEPVLMLEKKVWIANRKKVPRGLLRSL